MRHVRARNTKTPPKTKRPRSAKPVQPESVELTEEEKKAHEHRFAKLVKLGVIKLGKGGIPDELFEPGPPAPSALKALRWVRSQT